MIEVECRDCGRLGMIFIAWRKFYRPCNEEEDNIELILVANTNPQMKRLLFWYREEHKLPEESVKPF